MFETSKKLTQFTTRTMSFGLTPQRSDAQVRNFRAGSTFTTTRNVCDVLAAGAVVAGSINGVRDIMGDVITTEGDLVVGDEAGTATRLPLGSTGTVLTSNGTTAVWEPSSGVITTPGDLIVGNVSGEAARLPVGSSNTVLTSNGTTAAWAPPASVTTTQGDLIVGGVSGVPTRLAIGAATSALTSNGTTAQWQAPVITTQGDLIVGGVSGAPTRLPVGVTARVLTSNGTDPQWAPSGAATSGLAVQYDNVVMGTGDAGMLWLGSTSLTVVGSYTVTSLVNDTAYIIPGSDANQSWFQFVLPGTYLIEFSTTVIPHASDVVTMGMRFSTIGQIPFPASFTLMGTTSILPVNNTSQTPQCLVGRALHTAVANETFGIAITTPSSGAVIFGSYGAVLTVRPQF